jgi:hypothetical protein
LGAITLVLENLKNQYRVIFDSSGSGAHLVEVVVIADGFTDNDVVAFACP